MSFIKHLLCTVFATVVATPTQAQLHPLHPVNPFSPTQRLIRNYGSDSCDAECQTKQKEAFQAQVHAASLREEGINQLLENPTTKKENLMQYLKDTAGSRVLGWRNSADDTHEALVKYFDVCKPVSKSSAEMRHCATSTRERDQNKFLVTSGVSALSVGTLFWGVHAYRRREYTIKKNAH